VRPPGLAEAARDCLPLATGYSFNLIAGDREDSAGPQGAVGAFPEVTRDVLSAGLDIGDRAAAEIGERGELGLAVPGGAAIGGQFRT